VNSQFNIPKLQLLLEQRIFFKNQGLGRLMALNLGLAGGWLVTPILSPTTGIKKSITDIIQAIFPSIYFIFDPP
jgi:hypothetical protein